ncbi:hypothetical protein F5884DRAFT_854823 [Xylogone sp. PMI_703]|nr:hypothetical protein F5884DRAFT_854823 [Xylogone sp. PMI_703]
MALRQSKGSGHSSGDWSAGPIPGLDQLPSIRYEQRLPYKQKFQNIELFFFHKNNLAWLSLIVDFEKNIADSLCSQATIGVEPTMTSPSDPNKPLPPPPDPDAQTSESPPRPVARLNRIISTFTVEEIEKVFSGAPQFYCRSEGHLTGAPHPSVAFPWDLEVGLRDLTDHLQIQDFAWSNITAWPHITRDMSKSSVELHRERMRAHFLPRCQERPNMLSMQGIERGSVGFTAALELPAADLLQSDNSDQHIDDSSLAERRAAFLHSKEGLRPVSETAIIDYLISVSKKYHDDPLKHQPPVLEQYTELFTKLLYPPTRIIDSANPYSLRVQIEALLNVLGAKDVWYDFSLVEWRIRLGQILWGAPAENESDDEVNINEEELFESGSQKFWLLLQILLSCELLLRLDAVSQNVDSGLDTVTPTEIRHFDMEAKTSVRWSLILARYWLDNITIEKTQGDINPEAHAAHKHAPGWLATLTGAAPVPGPHHEEENVYNYNCQFRGLHEDRQASGLVHFARKLQWPNAAALAAKVFENKIGISENASKIPASALNLSFTSKRPSHFGTHNGHKQHPMRRTLSGRCRISATIHPSGWFSNTYISGLILPGETMGHLLMTTLLENDETAMARLGREVNLYGGFVYNGKSFWSKTCVVGRVLAGGRGSSECVGWISSDVVPKGSREGWVNIDVEASTMIDKLEKTKDKARIWHKKEIEHDGNVVGGLDIASILPGDFNSVADEPTEPLSITLQALHFFSAPNSIPTSPLSEHPSPLSESVHQSTIQTCSAVMSFSFVLGGQTRERSMKLKHDVQFVTAHPCVPCAEGLELVRARPAPTMSRTGKNFGLSDEICHPLHKAFSYLQMPLSFLLSASPNFSLTSLLSASSSTEPSTPAIPGSSSTTHKVLIINCIDPTITGSNTTTSNSNSTNVHTHDHTNQETPESTDSHVHPHPHTLSPKHSFGNDTEMLARALCADRGWDALISRRGRGCLACAVREAAALKWRVILRFG